MHKFVRNNIVTIVVFFIVLIYILLPTNNSSLDAYEYAASIKYGDYLFRPHHLLYNVFMFGIIKILSFFKLHFDTLALTKLVNSIFFGINLILLLKILKLLKIEINEILFIIIVVGFSFNSVRFGTENENYIIPITFSLLGSLYFLKFIRYDINKYLFYSGFFAALACLFHQIHFFWWLGLLVGIIFYIRKIKAFVLFLIPALIVPIGYLAVIYFVNSQEPNFYNIIHFVFHDYYSGSARNELGLNNFIFIFISTIRTFIQVHPIILLLIKRNILFSIPLLFLLAFLFVFIKFIWQKKLFYKRNYYIKIFMKTHIIIFVLQFLFAFYSVGNVEFMVPIPFLLFLSFLYWFKINSRVLQLLAITFFVWNFSYGLIANNLFKHYNDKVLVNFILKHPQDIFLVKEQRVTGQLEYKTGFNFSNVYYNLPDKNQLDEITKTNVKYFYTDIIDKPSILNRAKMLENTKLDFSKYFKEKILTYKGLFGKSYIYKVYINN